MTENKNLLDLLKEQIENAEGMYHYYRELASRYEGKIEALKDLLDELFLEEVK